MGKRQQPVVGYAEAKARFSAMVRRATQEHSPVVLQRQRGGSEGVVVVDRDDLAEALGDHRFETQVFIDEGRYAIGLEDFGLHGTGPTFEDALAALLEALRAYAEDYFAQLEFYRRTPNRAKHYLPLLRFRATPADKQLELLLETDAAPRQVATVR
jgi:predicted RNase H-like HicB family nuclease